MQGTKEFLEPITMYKCRFCHKIFKTKDNHECSMKNTSRYRTVKCKCGGIIAAWMHKDIFYCDKCGERYELYMLDYDFLIPNKMTGWVFPCKEVEQYEI